MMGLPTLTDERIDCVIKVPDGYLRSILDMEVSIPDIHGEKNELGITKNWFFISFKSVRILWSAPEHSRPIFEVWFINYGTGSEDVSDHFWISRDYNKVDTNELIDRLNKLKPFVTIDGMPWEMHFMRHVADRN